ncbi:MAG: hypothetical protein ACJAV6_000578 [Candidatus Paceibacteria bacterium]|jgi:hypothetical protein
MKKRDTLITISAVVVLGLVGFHAWQKNQSPEDQIFVEVIDGEEIALGYPLVESFSNPESNRESNKQIAGASTGSSIVTKTITKVVETIKQPFVLGFYYADNFKDLDLETCQSLNDEQVREVDFPEYDENNFKITDVSFAHNSAYLYVEADEIPKKICAQIVQFNKLTDTLFDAIHVIVNEA